MQGIIIVLYLLLPQGIATHPVVNEVMYNPDLSPDAYGEWIEIYNPTGSSWDLTNYKLGDEETQGGGEGMYLFPDGTTIGANSYLIICQRCDTFFNDYGFNADLEFKDSDNNASNDMLKYTSWATGVVALSNSGDEVILLDDTDKPIDVAVYGSGNFPGVTPHSTVAEGHSIERNPPGEDTDDCSVDMMDQNPETPGQPAANQPPEILSVWRGPYCPQSGSVDTICAEITDDRGLFEEDLYYSINGGPYVFQMMSQMVGDTFYGVIPVQPDESHIRYFVVAIDNDGAADTSETKGYFPGITDIDSLRGNDINGIPLYVGDAIRITGIATVPSHAFDLSSHIINIQNNGIGIVVKSTSPSTPIIDVGDSITVTGTISYLNGLTRILCPDDEPFVIEQKNKRTPDIYVLNYTNFYDYVGDTMNYEGLLVGLVKADKHKGTWQSPPASFSIWLKEFGTDAPDTVEMWIDKDTDIDDNSEPSWPKDVVGVYSQYDNSIPYWSGYEIMPRSYADFDFELAICLSEFNAVVGSGNVMLNWRSESEKDAYVYQVKRAQTLNTGSYKAELIGEVPASGNSSVPNNYGFIDSDILANTTYFYWLVGITLTGQRTIMGPVSVRIPGTVSPTVTVYPNPFTRKTTIHYSSGVNRTADSSPFLQIYDVSGRLVKRFIINDSRLTNIVWDGTDNNNRKVSEGIYFIRLKAKDKEVMRKVVLIK